MQTKPWIVNPSEYRLSGVLCEHCYYQAATTWRKTVDGEPVAICDACTDFFPDD